MHRQKSQQQKYNFWLTFSPISCWKLFLFNKCCNSKTRETRTLLYHSSLSSKKALIRFTPKIWGFTWPAPTRVFSAAPGVGKEPGYEVAAIVAKILSSCNKNVAWLHDWRHVTTCDFSCYLCRNKFTRQVPQCDSALNLFVLNCNN